MKSTLCIILLLIQSVCLFAQKKISTRNVNENIQFAAVDRPGELYILTNSGQIQKFDKDGKVTAVYKDNPSPTLFDPRDGSRLFAYFRADQHYSFLNPSFEVTTSGKLDPSIAIDPWLMTVSGDYNFWVLDAADKSLKKISASTGIITVDAKISEQPSDSISNYTYMREYQGFVFLLHEAKGILIFSGMGKHLKTIGQGSMPFFNFLGEELYYQNGDVLHFFNLFTAETRQMPLKQAARFALLTDERLFIIQNTSIDIFEIRP